MSITYIINKEFNGIEIKFTEKPTRAMLDKLKSMGFRWHNVKGVWFAKNTEERLAFAKAIADANDYTQLSIFPSSAPVPAQTEKQTEKPKNKKVESIKEAKRSEKREKATKTEKTTEVIQLGFRFNFGGVPSLEECKEKLDAEKKAHAGDDNAFVIDSLYKMCEDNESFRSKVIEKSYDDAFKHLYKTAEEMARKSKKTMFYLDNNKALAIILDFYNGIDTNSKVAKEN